MGGGGNDTTDAKIEGLKIQSSVYGIPIPLLYGVNRIPGNLLWYGGFKASPHTTTQGGKGGGVSNTTFTYSASLIVGLCHGAVIGIPRIWKGSGSTSGGIVPTSIVTTTEAYVPPLSGAMVYTCLQAANFSSVVSITCVTGSGDGYNVATLAQGTDYTVTAGTFTFFNDLYRNLSLSIEYQYVVPGGARTALTALNLSLIPGAMGQASWAPLAALAAAAVPPQSVISYSGIAYVAGQDYALSGSASMDNHTFEIQGPMAYTVSATQPDPDPAAVLRDILTNSRGGAAFPPARLDGASTWSDYCVSGGLLFSPAITTQLSGLALVAKFAELTNSAPVWSSGRLKLVPYGDAVQTGNGRTYTPNITPVYDLGDDQFVTARAGDPVVTVTRKPGADAYNHVRIKFSNAANQYNAEIAECKDQTDIDTNGIRSMSILDAPWVTSYTVARNIAQLLLQRSLYVRASYAFKLPANYALLEPMDLVTLTDPSQGLALTAVRITKVTEAGAAGGSIQLEAEDFPVGVASAALYPSQNGTGFQRDYNAVPGSVFQSTRAS